MSGTLILLGHSVSYNECGHFMHVVTRGAARGRRHCLSQLSGWTISMWPLWAWVVQRVYTSHVRTRWKKVPWSTWTPIRGQHHWWHHDWSILLVWANMVFRSDASELGLVRGCKVAEIEGSDYCRGGYWRRCYIAGLHDLVQRRSTFPTLTLASIQFVMCKTWWYRCVWASTLFVFWVVARALT